MDSLKDGNISSGSGRSSTPVFDGRKPTRPQSNDRVPPPPPAKTRMAAPPPTDSRVPPTDYNQAYKDRSFETNVPNDNNNADLYGTLPRRKTQKSQEHTQMCNNQKHESEIYQDFLDNQRRQNVLHSRTNSGATTPVNELNSEPVKYNYSGHSGSVRQPGCHGNGNYSNVPYPAGQASRTGVPCVPVQVPEIRNQSQHTEVGKTSVTTVNPPWQPSPRGTTRVVHSNTLPRGNTSTAKIHTASSAAIETAYSATVVPTPSGQCEPIPYPTGSSSGHVTKNASAASSARKLASESTRRIDRSASFSHIRPPAYSDLFPPRTGTNN